VSSGNLEGGKMKFLLYVIVILALAVIGVSFSVLNNDPLTIQYYFGVNFSFPVFLVLLITFVIGIIAGFLSSLQMLVRMQRQLVQARKEVRQIEQEVVNLRALPIKDVI
jgi:lipopolysaccharide assembly protein A